MDQYYTAPGGTMDRLTELLFPQTVALWAALEDPDSPESAARDYYNFLSPRLSRSEYGGLEFTDDRRGLVLWQTPEGGVTPALVAQLTTAYHGRTCRSPIRAPGAAPPSSTRSSSFSRPAAASRAPTPSRAGASTG